jgi:hypothetical protein
VSLWAQDLISLWVLLGRKDATLQNKRVRRIRAVDCRVVPQNRRSRFGTWLPRRAEYYSTSTECIRTCNNAVFRHLSFGISTVMTMPLSSLYTAATASISISCRIGTTFKRAQRQDVDRVNSFWSLPAGHFLLVIFFSS